MTDHLAGNLTITGAQQEKWLLDGFKNSTQHWDILGHQVFFAERDRNQAPEIDDVVDANVRNAVVLIVDVHRNWANYVKVDYKDPASPVVGSELVCTSISSTGNGTGPTTDATMAWNPHLKFYNDNRGYVNTRITKDTMTAEFRVMDVVTTSGSPVSTRASFAVQY
ncbi:phosphodiesterase/alkaline phosphatase D-like protein [Arthrobacter sp. CG_A4]|nr:phosphodiesterase/alkaline phosphatase D-like protein [Arthrobacter sp. CG_A4]